MKGGLKEGLKGGLKGGSEGGLKGDLKEYGCFEGRLGEVIEKNVG